MFRSVLTTAAAVFFAGAAVQAQTVISYTVLQSGVSNVVSKTYSGLDGAGTSLTVSTARPGGLLTRAGGPGSFPGLWFGDDEQSAVYSFTFSAPVTFAEFLFTAVTNNGASNETLSNFVSPSGALIGDYTNVQNTTWNGTTLFATAAGGSAVLGFSRAGGASFSSISFNHNVLSGAPNGIVIERMRYTLGSTTTVPEPSTYALMAVGLAAVGAASRRRRA